VKKQRKEKERKKKKAAWDQILSAFS